MLKISYGSRFDPEHLSTKNGYGYATKCMLESLDRLGYHVTVNDSTADVEIWFDQPGNWNFSKGPYKIGYHPWESTKLANGWVPIMNKCDEIWTPSPLIADWYTRYNVITVPVHVYEHGVEHEWAPVRREPKATKFLQVSAEDTRKGFFDTTQVAFHAAFPEKNYRRLTKKTTKDQWNAIAELRGVIYDNRRLDFKDLIELFYEHDVYVYPSWGEGFGLTPLQAMATGMPTITLPGWAPYARHIDPNLAVGHEMVDTPWPKIHPGQMMKPNVDDVKRAMIYTDEHYEAAADFAMQRANFIHREYDWDTLTAKVFGDLEHRLNVNKS